MPAAEKKSKKKTRVADFYPDGNISRLTDTDTEEHLIINADALRGGTGHLLKDFKLRVSIDDEEQDGQDQSGDG